MDSKPSQTSTSTPVVTKMHKEDQQATGGPNSFGVTSEERAAPQLSSDQTQSVSEGLETVLTQPITGKGVSSIARQVEEDEASRTIKLEDLAKLVSNVQPSFKDLDSLEDDPIIVVDDSDEDDKAEIDEVHTTTNAETEDASSQKHKLELEKNKAEVALLKAQPSFPNVGQLNELLVKGLKKQVHELEIELPGDLKEIPTKLEDFTKTVTSLTSQVAELKMLQWELLAEFISVATQVETVQAKIKTLDALPSLLNKVTNALNQFAQAIASKKTEDTSVPSVGQAGTQPAEGENNANQTTISYSSQPEEEHIKKDKGKKAMSLEEGEKESTNSDSDEDAKSEVAKRENEVRKEEQVDLLGPELVNKYYNDKLQYDKYFDKMLNRRVESRITNCDVLTKKGPITLKVYKEDGTSEVIPNFKAKLGINLDIPLSKQDLLEKLNDLANKKRKHADDIHDYFKANRMLKSSVLYEDHLAGTVLNKPVLGMIMFNSYHRLDFITIEDLKDFSNNMLYTVQEIFFRRHQGLRLNDHARTFSSLLLAEVDKRNLNPLKQMRTIEQLRQ
ncbi:hypothetical protein Tco_1004643 [Tanacetum coccineum]|uniref:Uncharacterized protein n=1 Tax=Tanacetum coccineum TaxID=301880 RepID=A0ABQ5FDU8_9ASTR